MNETSSSSISPALRKAIVNAICSFEMIRVFCSGSSEPLVMKSVSFFFGSSTMFLLLLLRLHCWHCEYLYEDHSEPPGYQDQVPAVQYASDEHQESRHEHGVIPVLVPQPPELHP